MKKSSMAVLLVITVMVMSLAGLPVYAAGPYQIAAGVTTKIEAEGYDSSSSLAASGAYLLMTAGGWSSYNLNVEVGSTYSFSITHLKLEADTVAGSAEIGVYVDDVLAKTFTFTTALSSPATNTLGGVELTAGQHTLKLQMGSARGSRINYFNLVNAKTNIPSTALTRIPAVYFADSTVTSATPIGGATGGVISTDGNLTVANNKYATYDINVQDAGLYKLSVCAGTDLASSALNVSDGSGNALCSGAITACPPQATTGVSPYRYGKINDIGTIRLPAGISKIKLAFTGGAYVYSLSLERLLYAVSSTEAPRIPAVKYVSALVSAITTTGGATGGVISNDGHLTFNPNQYATYDVNVKEAGLYKLTVCAGTDVVSAPLNVYDGSGNSLCSGIITACPPLSETGVAQYRYGKMNDIGTIKLSAGISKIKIEYKGAGAYVYSLSLVQNGPTVALYSGTATQGNEITQVQAGNIVDVTKLNGYLAGESVFYALAIYKISADGNIELYKVDCDTLTVESGTILTASVNDVIIEQGKTYKAKVFIWNNNMMGQYFEY